jgi:hypothetical protein
MGDKGISCGLKEKQTEESKSQKKSKAPPEPFGCAQDKLRRRGKNGE